MSEPTGTTDGVFLRDPDGDVYKVTVDDGGALRTTLAYDDVDVTLALDALTVNGRVLSTVVRLTGADKAAVSAVVNGAESFLGDYYTNGATATFTVPDSQSASTVTFTATAAGLTATTPAVTVAAVAPPVVVPVLTLDLTPASGSIAAVVGATSGTISTVVWQRDGQDSAQKGTANSGWTSAPGTAKTITFTGLVNGDTINITARVTMADGQTASISKPATVGVPSTTTPPSGGGTTTPVSGGTTLVSVTPNASRVFTIPGVDPYVMDWSDDMLESESLTMHANYQTVAAVRDVHAPALRDLLVRYWRDGGPNNADWLTKIGLLKAAGARGMVTIDTRDGLNPGNVVAYIRAAGGVSALYGVEGLNEWDTNSGLRDDAGQGFPNPNYQVRLYNALDAARKTDPLLAGLIIGTPTLADPLKTNQIGTVPADVIVHHPYQGGALPMDQFDTKWQPNAELLDGNRKVKPMLSSETGYHVVDNASNQPGITPRAAQRYVPRLFLEYRLRTRAQQRFFGASLYNLSQDQWSVLLRSDGSRTDAYKSLQAFNQAIADPGTRPAARRFPGTIDVGSATDVHFHLMHKINGEIVVALWRETKSVNQTTSVSTRTDVSVARVPVTLRMSSAVTGTVHRVSESTFGTSVGTVSGTAPVVQVDDGVTLVRLTA